MLKKLLFLTVVNEHSLISSGFVKKGGNISEPTSITPDSKSFTLSTLKGFNKIQLIKIDTEHYLSHVQRLNDIKWNATDTDHL